VKSLTVTQFLVLSLSTLAAGGVAAQDAVKGQRLAQTYCSRCHAIYRDGVSPRSLATPFREFPGRWRPDALGGRVFKRMLMGRHPRMPVSVSDPDEFAHIIAYIKTLDSSR
jgi:mono/diheme cytochrome c family protein